MTHLVAIVEDNPDNRLLLRALLADRYRIVEYVDGPTALDGIRSVTPSVVLLDISLPEMDGVEVLRRLRADPVAGRVPVIAVTAHAMAGDREQYLEHGFDGYVSKPIVDERVLYSAIEDVLDPGDEPQREDGR